MAMGTYKIKRLLCFMLTGVLGVIVCFMLFFMQFPLLGILLFGVIVGIFMGLVGFVITGMNPWIKAIQGDGIIVMDVNSTGVGKFYLAKVITNPLGGIDLSIDFGGGQEERRVYDRKITHRILSPQRIFMQGWKRKPVAKEKSIYEETKPVEEVKA